MVIAGVSGSGKSTLGAALAARLGLVFVDGDDLHPAENVAKMATGQPLDDADRAFDLQRVPARAQADHPLRREVAGAAELGTTATTDALTKLMGKGEAAARRELMELRGDAVEVDV